MNLRNRVIQLERKTRRSDDADEHLRCIEILVVPSRGDVVDLEEQIILLRLGGDDAPDPTAD